MFRERWGVEPGELEPHEYWQPWLGHWFHLRPEDMGDLTPRQMDDCVEYVDKAVK